MRERVTPNGFSVGIRVDGKDVGLVFSSISDADRNAQQLVSTGFSSVAIFDRSTGRAIRTLDGLEPQLKRRA